jgi:hypothetical protein
MSRKFVSIAVCAAIVLSGCGGGSSGATEKNQVIESGMLMQSDSFSFANFGASATDLNFDETDLVAMFGNSDGVCIDGKTDPCVPIAEAAVWARMVNQARQAGHCEGFAVLAASRFEKKETPENALLENEGDVTHGLMRAFATQFLPEVQQETVKWQQTAPSELIKQLKDGLASQKVPFSMGLYSDAGGHAVLPYALKYLDGDVVRVMVYDSNWPGADRYVDVNVKAETWEFSYSGKDPVTDTAKWSGGLGDIDLTSMDSRVNAKCPFCVNKSGIAKTILVLRSATGDWSVNTPGGVISPGAPDIATGSTRPLKRAQGDSAPLDYVIVLDSSSPATFMLPSATKVVGVTPNAALEFSSPESNGSTNVEVVVGDSGISSNDPGVVVSLADGNLAATANGQTAKLESSATGIAVNVSTASGQQISLNVNDATPTVEVKTTGATGLATGLEYEIAKQTGDNEISRESVSVTGKKSSVVESGSLGTNSVTVSIPVALQSTTVSASLPPVEERKFEDAIRTRNATLETTTTTTPATTTTDASTTTTVKRRAVATTVVPTTTITPTTTSAATTTTTTTTTVAAPTTTVAPTTTTTTTTVPAASAPWVVLATAPGNTQARDVIVDSDGNSYVLGAFCNSSVTIGSTVLSGANVAGQAHCNISLSKISPEGSVLWARSMFGSGGQNWGDYVDVDSNGNVYVVGAFNGLTLESGSVVLNDPDTSSNTENQFVMKFNSSGVVQWGKVLGMVRGSDVSVSSNKVYVVGNFVAQGSSVVFGATTLTSVSTRDMFVTRLDPSDGSFVWANRFGTSTPTYFSSADTDSSGNLLITGLFVGPTIQFGNLAPLNNASTGTSDVFVVKINDSGTPVWSLRGGGAGDEEGASIDASSQEISLMPIMYGASATYGSTTMTRTTAANTRAIALVEISSSGSVTGASIVADGDVWGGAIAVDSSGGKYLSGTFTGSANLRGVTRTAVGDSDAFLMKITSSGSLQWLRSVGNAQATYYSLVRIARGGGAIWNTDNAGSSTITIGTESKQLNDLDSLVIHVAADGSLP